MPSDLGVIDFVRQHPGVIALVFSVLWTILGVFALKAYQSFADRMSKLEVRMEKIETLVNVNLEKNILRIDTIAIQIEKTKMDIFDRIHLLEMKMFSDTHKSKRR